LRHKGSKGNKKRQAEENSIKTFQQKTIQSKQIFTWSSFLGQFIDIKKLSHEGRKIHKDIIEQGTFMIQKVHKKTGINELRKCKPTDMCVRDKDQTLLKKDALCMPFDHKTKVCISCYNVKCEEFEYSTKYAAQKKTQQNMREN